jgi:hypothetical protein
LAGANSEELNNYQKRMRVTGTVRAKNTNVFQVTNREQGGFSPSSGHNQRCSVVSLSISAKALGIPPLGVPAVSGGGGRGGGGETAPCRGGRGRRTI